MKKFAIIVAGGSGSRFGASVPKQFLPLAGMPVLMHTLKAFYGVGDVEITLVLPACQMQYWTSLCQQYDFSIPHAVVAGGDTRFQSVKNGLQSLSLAPGDLVAVHDGVRPLASKALIEKCFATAAMQGAVIPVVPVTDSIRQRSEDSTGSHRSVALDRSTLCAVQTPQVFQAKALVAAYDVDFNPFFTDDASVVEAAGGEVSLVEGETTNIKITHPIDIVVAEQILTTLTPQP